jgi:hypothetical protein
MGVGPHLVEHSAHCMFVLPQYLIAHCCIFIGIPYTMNCYPIPFHVFCAKAKCVRLANHFCYSPLKVCISLDIVFKHRYVYLNRVHPLAVDMSANEKLLHKMHWKMCHDVQKRRRKLLLHHTCCHYHIMLRSSWAYARTSFSQIR